ncbi:unnamed protein product [Cyprideis torosa]|uniref:acylphosphatase n=1 Tax=Cyprideis torosa TaxID=163714 RepID=A0A7R8WC64_9CRUS|nr:unnamed protein product [Cyprideis torosa]CAG0893082.1 unnamed protein product [Cyprideis torosa]
MELKKCTYEVYGRVQGVFFRVYTVEKAQQLGLKGYVLNTQRGTVYGEMEGKADAIEKMKNWLQAEGSPMSHIEKAVFSNEGPIDKFSFKSFDKRRGIH